MNPALSDANDQDKATLIAKEYEDFAYIVSHDLNAPLRHVKEFTRLLVGGRASNLTTEEREYIRFLENSLGKLDGMQRALLEFSRLNTKAGELQRTDLNQSVKKVIARFTEAKPSYMPVFEVDKLPTVAVDPKQIEALFYHLIDNALKFHNAASLKRKVTLSVQAKGPIWLFEIRDNGIGIDEKYHQEIFRLFRRLDSDNFPGIGAGLTIANKIVQRHGGIMYIESAGDSGTSFFFTLPK